MLVKKFSAADSIDATSIGLVVTFLGLFIYLGWVRNYEPKRVIIIAMIFLSFKYITAAGFYADFDIKIGISTKAYKIL